MSRIGLVALVLFLPVSGLSAAVIGPPKAPYDDRADDVAKSHVELIDRPDWQYSIRLGGTVDGTMTRMPIGYAAFAQGWQPNRSVLIENVGQANVHNPRIIVNGQRDWTTLDSMVAEATRGYSTPAAKARAIWEFVRRQRFHACTWDGECSDALKALNVYGYTLCGNQAQVINDLWQAAGLKTRRCYPIGHCVTEVFYDGAYHLLDSDEHVICLLRDNQTIASAEQIVDDHDLVKRTHTYGIGQADNRRTDEFSASLYSHEGDRSGTYPRATHHRMDLTLRPGESIEFRWDHVGKQYTAGTPVKPGQKKRDGLGDLLAGWGTTAYDNLRNGKWRYQPDLSRTMAAQGAASVENALFDARSGRIKTTTGTQPASITWQFASPYVFVGGRATATIELADKAQAQWRFSTDRKTWTTIALTKQPGSSELTAVLDEIISPRRQPAYRYWLQLSLTGTASVAGLRFESDIQTSALGLPELTLGENHIRYADASAGSRQVRITHRWLERTAWHPPAPPAGALQPPDNSVVEGARPTFRWQEASDPDGDTIVDYHFELSADPALRWPLSPNFEKRISLTPSKGKPEWSVPYAGLLNPGTTYFWHVRALDAKGVWGPWSRPFRFRIQAPGVPLEVRLEPEGRDGWKLTWKPNPKGRPPVAYKVYGSDERGFTASDTEYQVYRGKGFVTSMAEYTEKPANAADVGMVKVPANLLAKVKGTALPVVGPDLNQPNNNRAFYRVVAVDAAGVESGPSDFAAVPRPFVYTRPQTPARVGAPYRYQPKAICSIGDLRCRRSKASSYNAAFWDREMPAFKAVRLPEGLTLDPQTGLIQGVPKQAGTSDIVFEVTTGSDKTRTVSQPLTIVPP